MPRRIVALLTDFGTAGPYVAAMKGAVLSVCQDIDLLDITHEVTPHDIAGGAAVLAAATPYLPRGTIVVAVVDPGVGAGRHALAAESGGYVLLGPDNGLLAPLFDLWGVETLVSIEEPRFARGAVSATFEGRDRFGPAAAWIAAGTAVAELGPPLSRYRPLNGPPLRAEPRALSGSVVWVDRFGNLVTNISRRAWLGEGRGRAGVVSIAGACVGEPVRTYADLAAGAAGALFGSPDQLEIAVREGSAAERFRAGPGAGVEVVWG
ncbi:MAG: SAM-dependent chlorinase/fluorinase [Vicinamibacterales bacterium]|nr:SAM-dependent chlorinase/fluorinase [Vicinamibacterales bacterium]